MYLYTTASFSPYDEIRMPVTLPTKSQRAPLKTRSKHQERTEATQAKLLVAAQDVFTRDGFANARLEQIAVEAGYTRGAIYAHYKSKEDLFLALLEQRVQASITEFTRLMETQQSKEDKIKVLRAMLVRKASDKSWAMLGLEFKLFALRQPKLKARLQRLMSMLHSTSKRESFRGIFGDLKPKEMHAFERRMALVGSVMSAAVLESHFRPELLSGKNMDAVLEEVFEALVRV
jgi:AcrR family transcriptional regulator